MRKTLILVLLTAVKPLQLIVSFLLHLLVVYLLYHAVLKSRNFYYELLLGLISILETNFSIFEVINELLILRGHSLNLGFPFSELFLEILTSVAVIT